MVSGLHSRYHAGYVETMDRIRDGAIGDIVSIEENFLRAPYGVTDRGPGLTELEWQCSTQYHFRWISGDDVPQSLVHNMDRASWGVGQRGPGEMPRIGRTGPQCSSPSTATSMIITRWFMNSLTVSGFTRCAAPRLDATTRIRV
jgi:hypothetical protein